MYGLGLSVAGVAARALTPIQQAIAVLRRFGTDAHVYLRGIGMLNGLQAANYIDSAGTQAGAVDQPVELVLDASGGLGVELVTNAGIAYNASLSSGLLPSIATSSATLAYGFLRNGFLTSGKRYQVTAVWSGNTLNRNLTFDDGQGPLNTQLQSTAQSGSITAQFNATAATFFAYATGTSAAGETFSLISLSVREVTGIHASQATTASKPILRRGVVNLLTQNNTFTDGSWFKQNATLAVNGVSPNGAATDVTCTTTVGAYLEHNAVPAGSGKTFTAAVWIKASGAAAGKSARIYINRDSYAEFVYGDVVMTGSWVLYTYTGTLTTSPVSGVGVRVDTAQSPSVVSEVVAISAIALFQGTYTAAQIQALGGIPLTTTAPASTALGPYYLEFKGAHSMGFSGPLFQMADDHCVIAGAVCNNPAAYPTIARPAYSGAAAITAWLYVNADSSIGSKWANDVGTAVYSGGNAGQIVNSQPFVGTAIKRGVNCWARFNGVNSPSPAVAPTGACTLNQGDIGATLSGSIYPVIAIKGTVTDSDLLLLEKLVGSMSGVTI